MTYRFNKMNPVPQGHEKLQCIFRGRSIGELSAAAHSRFLTVQLIRGSFDAEYPYMPRPSEGFSSKGVDNARGAGNGVDPRHLEVS
jgi:hypothetical protein